MLVVIACRGGTGTGGQVSIPVFTPTVSPQICLNDDYPSDAPQFGDDSSFAYTTTETGLRIFDHVVGTGDASSPGDGVSVNYTGFLSDGCIFDTSEDRGQPTLFGLSQLVDGMEEGVGGMLVGGKRRVSIPANLAYQGAGIPGRIPANATIIFEVELVEVVPPAAAQSSATSTPGAESVNCMNDTYPADAPQFGDDASIEYTTTGTGLRIFDYEVGTGQLPGPTSGVLVKYTGFLSDGCIFDTSETRGEPTRFGLNQLIPGMTEGIGGMLVGGKRRISIPANLAYKDAGVPGVIPSNSTIIFEVELIEIIPPAGQ